MKRVDDTFRQVDKFGAGKDGYTEGDPGVTARTGIRADMLDHIQEEIARVPEAAGLTLGGGYGQLLDTLQAIAADSAFSEYTDHAYAGTIANNGTEAACLFDVPGSDDETWVVCHLGGEISRSTDRGVTWSEITSGVGANNLHSVCSNGSPSTAGSLFCAVGAAGDIHTSPTGSAWTARTAGGGYAGIFRKVIFAGGQFIAVGASGAIQTSPDGITWTARTAAGGYTDPFWGVAHSGTLYTIVGENGQIQTSPDGITWTARSPAGAYAGDWVDVAYGNGVFVAVSVSDDEIQTSPDGITWTARTAPTAWGDSGALIFACGLFIAFESAQGFLAVSIDGIVWRARRFTGNGTMIGAGVGPGRVIIATPNGVQRSRRASVLLDGF